MACFAFFVPRRGVGVRDRCLVAFGKNSAKSILPSIDNNRSMKPAPCTAVRLFGVMGIAPYGLKRR
jgi:hypothetical protein